MNFTAKIMNRDEFMKFFRDDASLNQLSADDRIEIFSQILVGESDITKKLLNNLLDDYGVENIEITEIPYGTK